MPVEVIWDDIDHTIIRYLIDGYWNWDEIPVAIQAARTLMVEVEHPISAIVDLSQSRSMPNFARWRGERLGAASPKQLKLVVIVGDDALGSLFDIFTRFLPQKARYAPTLDEARAMIAESISTDP